MGEIERTDKSPNLDRSILERSRLWGLHGIVRVILMKNSVTS